jgi:hypothetical protein
MIPGRPRPAEACSSSLLDDDDLDDETDDWDGCPLSLVQRIAGGFAGWMELGGTVSPPWVILLNDSRKRNIS